MGLWFVTTAAVCFLGGVFLLETLKRGRFLSLIELAIFAIKPAVLYIAFSAALRKLNSRYTDR